MSALLSLTDDAGNIYVFEPDFFLKAMPWSLTQDVKKVAFAAGGKNTADASLNARSVTIEGALRADTLAALETKARALVRAVLAGGKLSVSDDTVTRYIDVRGAQVDDQFMGDYRHERPFAITFLAEYPFWQDSAEQTSVTVCGSTPFAFTVDNSGSDHFSLPIITIAADQGVAVPAVTLQNMSDSGQSFQYNDPAFVAGDVLVVDCRQGLVTRNGNDARSLFSPAAFLRLPNVVNSFLYTGAAVTITVAWRRVYL